MHDEHVKPPGFRISLDQATATEAIKHVEDGPRPVAIMQDGIVFVGDGPNAQPLNLSEGFVNAEQVNAAFGAGSDVTTIVLATLDTQRRETWQEREARRDREAFEKATKIDAKDYDGWVSWPGRGQDGFFESVDELRAHCVSGKLALPSFVWACTREPFKLDADHILDQALEEHHDGARGEVSSAEEQRLQTLLDEWTAKQNIVSWHEDRERVVMLPAGDDAAPHVCGLDRKALTSAIEWQAQEWVEEFMIHDMARLSDEPIKSCFAAIADPEKLAAIVAELLREHGWQICDDDPGDDLRLPSAEVFADDNDIGMHLYKTWNDCHGKPPSTGLTMCAARAFILALLNAPTATTQDVERMIQDAARGR